MTTPIHLAAPKPHLGQHATLAQSLHDMVVGETLNKATPAIPWSLNATISVPFDTWQPLPARHNFHTRFPPAVNYGYNRIHTASLFSPHDEIVDSSRKRLVTQSIGPHTPESIIAPSTFSDTHPLNLKHATPSYKIKKTKPLPIIINEKILWKLRSRRGSQQLQSKHDRHHPYSPTTPRTQILGQ